MYVVGCVFGFILLYWILGPRRKPMDLYQERIEELTLLLEEVENSDPPDCAAVIRIADRIKWLEEQREIERERKPDSRYPTVQQRGSLTNT